MCIKTFDLVPGDRVRITIPGQDPWTKGWGEGTIITAHFCGPEDGWFIALNKDKVDPNWELGYGFWKQGIDGGQVEKLE